MSDLDINSNYQENVEPEGQTKRPRKENTGERHQETAKRVRDPFDWIYKPEKRRTRIYRRACSPTMCQRLGWTRTEEIYTLTLHEEPVDSQKIKQEDSFSSEYETTDPEERTEEKLVPYDTSTSDYEEEQNDTAKERLTSSSVQAADSHGSYTEDSTASTRRTSFSEVSVTEAEIPTIPQHAKETTVVKEPGYASTATDSDDNGTTHNILVTTASVHRADEASQSESGDGRHTTYGDMSMSLTNTSSLEQTAYRAATPQGKIRTLAPPTRDDSEIEEL